MGLTNPGVDIAFYTRHALTASGPVLELGCGTGRITLPLVRAGCEVAGIDVSRRMLDALERKAAVLLGPQERGRLRVHCVDMRNFDLGTVFPIVICPFSAFNYVVEDREHELVLACIHRHLRARGIFVMDTFISHYDVLVRSDAHVYLDYRRDRGDGTVLQREKAIHKDLSVQVNLVERTYSVFGPDGSLMRRIVTRERIRYFFRHELRQLLESCGFEVLEQCSDFEGDYRYEALTMAFVCRRR